MLIAGEASGDLLAAELVSALRDKLPDAGFFGAGGPQMAAAGVELAFDMTRHSVVGFTDVLKNLFKLRRISRQLLTLAVEREPDAVIGVDYGEFNSRFARAVRHSVRRHPGGWNPKSVKFISPQVWASRPGRAAALARDYDLLLSIFPFEKQWYAQRAPRLRVEFVGHPMVDRFANAQDAGRKIEAASPSFLLLPGSRKSELNHHLPAILAAVKLIQKQLPSARFKIVLPDHTLARLAQALGADLPAQIGGLPAALAGADVVISKTGTVTMECAFAGVPAVTLYKGSWLNYQIARHFITVSTFTMPNLLAGEEVYPEFLQTALTPDNIARAALDLLQNASRRQKIKSQLNKIVASLGEPGATRRAADAILSLFQKP